MCGEQQEIVERNDGCIAQHLFDGEIGDSFRTAPLGIGKHLGFFDPKTNERGHIHYGEFLALQNVPVQVQQRRRVSEQETAQLVHQQDYDHFLFSNGALVPMWELGKGIRCQLVPEPQKPKVVAEVEESELVAV